VTITITCARLPAGLREAQIPQLAQLEVPQHWTKGRRRSDEICRQEGQRARGTWAQPEVSPHGPDFIGCFSSCSAWVHTEQLGKNMEAKSGHVVLYREEGYIRGCVSTGIFFWGKCLSWGAGGTSFTLRILLLNFQKENRNVSSFTKLIFRNG
jgi:hypothetical protein